jgi:hypothetical protein
MCLMILIWLVPLWLGDLYGGEEKVVGGFYHKERKEKNTKGTKPFKPAKNKSNFYSLCFFVYRPNANLCALCG